jgi:acyl-CoA thioester hydrolase
MAAEIFYWQRRVQFYETDLMGIVHHSNYIRFFEEARVAWAQSHGILDYQKPETASHLAVLETRCRHLKPCFFGDDLKVQVQVKMEGVRIFFQYRIENTTQQNFVAVGMSSHAPLNKELKPIRPGREWKSILENEQWTETWL